MAFPTGMVEPGATVPQTLRAELTQEALGDDAAIDELFTSCQQSVVYRGHVDDWRNTDHAWMETTAVHFHADRRLGERLRLHVTDKAEIKSSAWYDMNAVTSMYASHLDWLQLVRKWCEEELARETKEVKVVPSRFPWALTGMFVFLLASLLSTILVFAE